MSQLALLDQQPSIIYPDSYRKPVSDNTKQFRYIAIIKENLELLFADHPSVFIAGDLLWYPVEGNKKTCQAPNIMVVFGRPKGDRGSYQQWKEENIAPSVAFEILSPGNTLKEMAKKLVFYQQYGVEEYYIYDPEKNDLNGYLRKDNCLEIIEEMNGWISPLLKIKFELTSTGLEIYDPQNNRFLTYVELSQNLKQEKQRAEEAEAKLKLLEQKLLELGVNPETIS